ncbi:hypothetical protein BgiBS90_020051 [Biomphalaria glabrata]|nr:hypothetical protein BgiBS90_020051 [Biomphalaria glabrata]
MSVPVYRTHFAGTDGNETNHLTLNTEAQNQKYAANQRTEKVCTEKYAANQPTEKESTSPPPFFHSQRKKKGRKNIRLEEDKAGKEVVVVAHQVGWTDTITTASTATAFVFQR